MARWKLMEPHYLNAVGRDQVEWESKETDRVTGRTGRIVYKVPRLLDPKDPADFNYREDGIIVVCHDGKGKPRDIIFEGDPTPSMEPLDEEAEAITNACRENWHDPINEFSAISFQDRLLMNMQEQIADIKAKEAQVVPADEVAALRARIAELEAAQKPTRRV